MGEKTKLVVSKLVGEWRNLKGTLAKRGHDRQNGGVGVSFSKGGSWIRVVPVFFSFLFFFLLFRFSSDNRKGINAARFKRIREECSRATSDGRG